ncbi:MAG: fasciclin domain-containing protein [Acholeplasmataceae bacterium]
MIAAAPFYQETLNGDFLYIEVVEGNVLVNGATVVVPNVLASNGVIHAIDQVVLPQSLIYETGFESAEGFNATTTYNNTSVVFQGPAESQ